VYPSQGLSTLSARLSLYSESVVLYCRTDVIFALTAFVHPFVSNLNGVSQCSSQVGNTSSRLSVVCRCGLGQVLSIGQVACLDLFVNTASCQCSCSSLWTSYSSMPGIIRSRCGLQHLHDLCKTRTVRCVKQARESFHIPLVLFLPTSFNSSSGRGF